MRGMVVIVATQMLESMTLNPRPTRAEVSDVSAQLGTEVAVMLGETASGNHPVASLKPWLRLQMLLRLGLLHPGETCFGQIPLDSGRCTRRC